MSAAAGQLTDSSEYNPRRGGSDYTAALEEPSNRHPLLDADEHYEELLEPAGERDSKPVYTSNNVELAHSLLLPGLTMGAIWRFLEGDANNAQTLIEGAALEYALYQGWKRSGGGSDKAYNDQRHTSNTGGGRSASPSFFSPSIISLKTIQCPSGCAA